MHYKTLPISFILLFITCALSAQNDTLLLNNGNLLVGEIKTLQKGVVTMETDYSDSDFKIEWDKVRQIFGEQTFIISLSDGTRLIGTIRSDPEDPSKVIIFETVLPFEADLLDVVTMKAFKGNFLGRLSASVDLGLTLTKANNLRQFSARSNLGYQGRAWAADASFDAVRSLQDSIEATRRTDASIGGRVLFQKMWFFFLSGNFLQNDEQKLKLRSTTTSGIGHYIVNSNRIYFAGAAGLAWNNEQFTEEQPRQNSLEGFAGLEINLFDIEDFSLLTNLSVFPGISQKGRLRADFKIDLKYDLPLDFYIKLGYTHNFDNQPAASGSKNDYVFQTTVGWEL
jgi:hypothetical protein